MREPPTESTSAPGQPGLDSPRSSALLRGAAFMALWLVLLPSLNIGDVAVGAGAAIGATWVSLRLLPPATGCLRFGSLLLLLPHFLWQSVRAGVDVALRALAPQPKLHTGYVRCPLDFAPGLARNTFSSITSLLPGTVPCDEVDGALVYHCIDTRQAVVEQLWEEERRLSRALVAGRSHG